MKQVNWALQGFVYIVEVANLISLKTYNWRKKIIVQDGNGKIDYEEFVNMMKQY